MADVENVIENVEENVNTKDTVVLDKKDKELVVEDEVVKEDACVLNGNSGQEEEEKEEVQVLKSETTPVPDEKPSETPTVEESSESKAIEEPKENGLIAEEKPKEDKEVSKGDSVGNAVAKHYNDIPAGTKESRKESRIFHLRNFNNWVKTVIITEFLGKIKRRKRLSDEINILDLACGKGGDLLKWQKANVDHVIMADIASTSIDQCKERYAKLEKESRSRHSRERLFTTEFYAADCTKENLCEKFKNPDIKLDLTSCQFAFHYSFESYSQAELMFKNACKNLRTGGYFVGTTPDAHKLVKRIKSMESDSFGNSVYNIKPDSKDNFPLFGAKYMFHLEGVVDCPEFLVYFPAFEKIAAKYNMKLVWKKNFHELFKEHEKEYSSLLSKMSALEVYPAPSNKQLVAEEAGQYKNASEYMDRKATKNMRVGTLSADEWEAAGLYLAFAFEKVEPPRQPRSSERVDDRKRHRDVSRESAKSRESSRSSRSKDKRKSDSSGPAKKSRRENEVEVYEIKDEIQFDDEVESTPSDINGDTSDKPVEIVTETSTDKVVETSEESTPVKVEDVVMEATPEDSKPVDIATELTPVNESEVTMETEPVKVESSISHSEDEVVNPKITDTEVLTEAPEVEMEKEVTKESVDEEAH
ncbi:mRNA cap guanine-N7 methyltransferase isoform X1 [Hydra vulgaris]|uniref:mRNA (guanine-N(7))-methyltransferase n=1 Tax=Hydra vulgaris TaxID=6087 RepID=A0ABM4DK68_HYDVU